jgi:NAD(P)-dependent dehydrogenase (short-subunit alcohol dehydrogenase family)
VQLEGKVALITGGGTGIGAAIARRFAAEGASVVIMGRRREPLEGVAAQVGCVAFCGDAADPDDARDAVAAAVDHFGGLDIVIANAGKGHMNAALEATDEQLAESVRSNITSHFCIVRAALPQLIERRGSVVVVSSVAGIGAGPRIAVYTTSKHAILGLVRSLARDYGPQGVRVNALCPGWVKTSVTEEVVGVLMERDGITREQAYDVASRYVPLRRPGRPEEMASVCLFLASEESSFMTGAVLVADGGAHVVDVGTLAFDTDQAEAHVASTT